jgi:hypothetical protein
LYVVEHGEVNRRDVQQLSVAGVVGLQTGKRPT